MKLGNQIVFLVSLGLLQISLNERLVNRVFLGHIRTSLAELLVLHAREDKFKVVWEVSIVPIVMWVSFHLLLDLVSLWGPYLALFARLERLAM